MPEYLRFLKGVVDSSDLPLNISREMLQENAKILKIQKNLVRKTLSELQKLFEQSRDKYLIFYREFGRILKEGIHTDSGNRDKIRDLLLFETMNKPAGELVSLKEYLSAMPANQKEIYCVIGDSRKTLENSPHLEILRARGFDVIFMTDPIDEWVLAALPEYEGKKIKAADRGEIELDDDTKKAAEEKKKEAVERHKTLIEFLKKELSEKVKDVRFSDRLTDSACCLVSDNDAPSAHMERVLKALHQNVPANKRSLELNPAHPLLASLQKLYDRDPSDTRLGEYAELLFDQALLTEGSPVPDPLKFSKSVSSLMVQGLENAVGK